MLLLPHVHSQFHSDLNQQPFISCGALGVEGEREGIGRANQTDFNNPLKKGLGRSRRFPIRNRVSVCGSVHTFCTMSYKLHSQARRVVPFSSGNTIHPTRRVQTRASCMIMISNSGRTRGLAPSIDENLRHSQSSSHVPVNGCREPTAHVFWGFCSAILLSANIAANSIACGRGHLARMEIWRILEEHCR